MIPTSGAILVAANNDPNCPINANVTPTQTGELQPFVEALLLIHGLIQMFVTAP